MSDASEVTQLVLRERQARDRGWWEQMQACFHPDAVIAVSWLIGSPAEFVAGSQATFARGIRPVHRLSPPAVHLHGDRAVLELPAAIEVRDEFEGVDADLVSYTRLLYRAQRSEPGWLITALTCIYERDTLSPVLPGTPIPLDAGRLARFRAPYRYLAYHLSSTGASVGDGLYGDDEPGRVQSLYDDAFAWLHEGRTT
jgi:hypothetical protein